MSTVERLVELIRAAGLPVDDGWQFRRTHAGHWQRAGGAWSWYLVDAAGHEICGGYAPVRELVKGGAAGRVQIVGCPAWTRPPTIEPTEPATLCDTRRQRERLG